MLNFLTLGGPRRRAQGKNFKVLLLFNKSGIFLQAPEKLPVSAHRHTHSHVCVWGGVRERGRVGISFPTYGVEPQRQKSSNNSHTSIMTGYSRRGSNNRRTSRIERERGGGGKNLSIYSNQPLKAAGGDERN